MTDCDCIDGIVGCPICSKTHDHICYFCGDEYLPYSCDRPDCAAVANQTFDPTDSTTWPVPWRPRHRRNANIDCWLHGFQTALDMADHFHKHGHWPEVPR